VINFDREELPAGGGKELRNRRERNGIKAKAPRRVISHD
jgi:hypothetical protein